MSRVNRAFLLTLSHDLKSVNGDAVEVSAVRPSPADRTCQQNSHRPLTRMALKATERPYDAPKPPIPTSTQRPSARRLQARASGVSLKGPQQPQDAP